MLRISEKRLLRRMLLALLFLLHHGLSIGQEDSFDSSGAERILWTYEQLKWEDFQGIADSVPKHGALSCTAIRFFPYYMNSELFVNVSCCFYKKLSWVKPHVFDSYTLMHEQTHFNITEIFARLVRKKIQSNPKYYKEDFDRVKKLVFDYTSECDKYQDQYDLETRHSLDSSKQTIWNQKIIDSVNTLNEYRESISKLSN